MIEGTGSDTYSCQLAFPVPSRYFKKAAKASRAMSVPPLTSSELSDAKNESLILLPDAPASVVISSMSSPLLTLNVTLLLIFLLLRMSFRIDLADVLLIGTQSSCGVLLSFRNTFSSWSVGKEPEQKTV
jgi:hypothetical protein